MAESQKVPEAHIPPNYVPIYDPKIGNAHVGVKKGFIGQGSFKEITGDIWTIIREKGDEVFLGSAGTPTTAGPRQDSDWDVAIVEGTFDDETVWLDAFVNHLLYDDFYQEHAILKAKSNPTERSFTQASIPFAHSLGDVMEIIDQTPEDILPEGAKRLLLLVFLSKATRALEKFHSMRFAFDWKNTVQATHNDAGQYHLNNFLFGADRIDQEGVLIDYSHVQVATPEEQKAEMHEFTRQVMNHIAEDHRVRYFPLDLLQTLSRPLSDGTLPYLDSRELAKRARQELKKIRQSDHSGHILHNMKHKYFLSYLYWRGKSENGLELEESTLEVIHEGIELAKEQNPTIAIQYIH